MPDWLYLSGYSDEARYALWTIAAVAVTTFVLFVYTLGLRVATIRNARRQRELVLTWRERFAIAVLGDEATAEQPVPTLPRRHRQPLLELWNRLRLSVEGQAAANLNKLASRLGLDAVAGRLFHSRNLQKRVLAIQALGQMRDTDYRESVLAMVTARNTLLSMTAALALVEIDPDLAVRVVVPRIATRKDWPKTQVSLLLKLAGSDRISEPLYRALRAANDTDTVYLLNFAPLVEADVLEALVVELLRESRDPHVLNAALKLVTGFQGVPRLAALTRHDTWFVRMQAAKVIGRLGDEEHVSLVVALLDDPEWWVRYRAAQSLVSLPFLGPNKLRRIRREQTDPYASDILDHVFAEAGLA